MKTLKRHRVLVWKILSFSVYKDEARALLKLLDRYFLDHSQNDDWVEPGSKTKLEAALSMFEKKLVELEMSKYSKQKAHRLFDYALHISIDVYNHQARADLDILRELDIKQIKFVRSLMCDEMLFPTAVDHKLIKSLAHVVEACGANLVSIEFSEVELFISDLKDKRRKPTIFATAIEQSCPNLQHLRFTRC
jgi:hypothetical protein